MKKSTIISIFTIQSFLVGYGQKVDCLGDSLNFYLKSIENNADFNNSRFESFAKKASIEDTCFLNLLRKQEKNKVYNVRNTVFNFYRSLGTFSQDTLFRRLMNNNILRCCNDTLNLNSLANINNFSICNNLLSKYDKNFTKNDFDDLFKQSLIKIIKTKRYEIEYNLVLFIGWLELRETIPDLKFLLKNGINKENYEFAIDLALARMGEKEYFSKSIEKIKEKYMYKNRAIISDDDKYFTYIKQPEILQIFINALDNKESFSIYDPLSKNQIKNVDVACLALESLINKIEPLKSYIYENYFDKNSYYEQKKEIIELKIYDKYPKFKEPIKFIDCSTNTYKAAKKWIIENKGKYEVTFDRSKYY